MTTKHTNAQDPGCFHCGCSSPLFTILKDDVANMLAGLAKVEVSAKEDPPAEAILISTAKGGTIRAMKRGDAKTTYEAIGIYKGKVLTASSLKNVLQTFANHNIHEHVTKELQPGQTLIPGLIEPHFHIVPPALMGTWLDLGRFDEKQEMKATYDLNYVHDTIKSYIDKNNITAESGEWVLGQYVDPALMPFTVSTKPGQLNQLAEIDNTFLDGISSDVPILLISASLHTLYLNTNALYKVWNANNTEPNKNLELKPPFNLTKSPYNYASQEDYATQTKGRLQETTGMAPALHTIPKAQHSAMVANLFPTLSDMFDQAASRGVTFMYDAGLTPEYLEALEAYLLRNPKQKKVRIGGALACLNQDAAERLPQWKKPSEYRDLYLGHVKVISDGSNQGLTGYQLNPYCCNPPDNSGNFNFPDSDSPPPKAAPSTFIKLITAIAGNGWPMMIHANGSAAVEFAIQAYGNLSEEQRSDKRHRIEHCSLVQKDSFQRMFSLGISPSFLIGHVGYWGWAFSEAIFGDGAQTLDLCKSALNNNLRISLHCDYAVTPLGPLRQMEQAITRRMEGAPEPKDPIKSRGLEYGILNAAERLSNEEALRAVTYDAAWQCHAENWVGSLDDGYFADFVILAEDPVAMGVDCYKKMRNVQVLETWKGGELTYTNRPIVVSEGLTLPIKK